MSLMATDINAFRHADWAINFPWSAWCHAIIACRLMLHFNIDDMFLRLRLISLLHITPVTLSPLRWCHYADATDSDLFPPLTPPWVAHDIFAIVIDADMFHFADLIIWFHLMSSLSLLRHFRYCYILGQVAAADADAWCFVIFTRDATPFRAISRYAVDADIYARRCYRH